MQYDSVMMLGGNSQLQLPFSEVTMRINMPYATAFPVVFGYCDFWFLYHRAYKNIHLCMYRKYQIL
jgi:hypothetical protein